MKKIALVLGLGIFLMSFNAFAIFFEGEAESPEPCVQVAVSVSGVDELVNLSDAIEISDYGVCVEVLIEDTDGGSFVLVAQSPFAFRVMAGTLKESEPAEDARVFRKCILNAEREDPMSVVLFFAVDDEMLPPWEFVLSSLFQFGAYPLAEGTCE